MSSKFEKSIQEISDLGDKHRKIEDFLTEFEKYLSDEVHDELVDLHNLLVNEKVRLLDGSEGCHLQIVNQN